MTFWQLFRAGGFTMYFLVLCSIFSLAVIVERFLYYRRRERVKRENFMAFLKQTLVQKDIQKALELSKNADAPFVSVVRAGLTLSGRNESVIMSAMEREITIETTKLERMTGAIGTIGSTAVYIGLFGTVLGIMRAFADIAQNGQGGINVVINGIAEALICTAAGLAVAVPAIIAYNYFTQKIAHFTIDMELAASETMDLLNAFKS